MTKSIKVKKRSGDIEPFDSEKVKISIQKATIDAGYNLNGMGDYNLIDDVNKGIVEKAGEKNVIESSTIRKIILNELETAESSIAESWKRFEKRNKTSR
jgi:transcriptional regulator NrdR family protein